MRCDVGWDVIVGRGVMVGRVWCREGSGCDSREGCGVGRGVMVGRV